MPQKKKDRERKKHYKNRPHSTWWKEATSTTRTTELRNRHMWKKHAQTERASKNAEKILSKKENKTTTYHASNCEYKSGERRRRQKEKTIAAKCAKRRSRRRGKKAAARCRESWRAKRNDSVRVQRLQREHTNILITRVKEPNNLLSITISDSLINYAH